jgi:hypothetical protein
VAERFKEGRLEVWKSGSLDAGCWMLDAGCWILDYEHLPLSNSRANRQTKVDKRLKMSRDESEN